MIAVFQKTLVRDGEVRSFQIRSAPSAGWESSERASEQAVRRHILTDWHRVERTVARFRIEIDELRRQGWRDAV